MRVCIPLVWSGGIPYLRICSGDPDAVYGCALQVESAEIKIKGTIQKVVFYEVCSCEGTEQYNECYRFFK